jgi:hypothetical protein
MPVICFSFKQAHGKFHEAQAFLFSINNSCVQVGADAGDFKSLAVLFDLFFSIHL